MRHLKPPLGGLGVFGEFYIAPLYNHLINKGRKLIVDMADEVNILGTPEELNLFLKKS